jgi:asparagine synthase (glutamine-hydrolysing)
MTMFLCAFRPDGEPLDRAALMAHVSRMRAVAGDVELNATLSGPFAAVAQDARAATRPLLGRWRGLVGVGDVRLDNRAELARVAGIEAYPSISDLEVALAAIDAHGDGIIQRILGDYGFVYWDARACKLVAVRDAFGVRPLYFRATPSIVLFSSRIGALASDEHIDLDYVGRFLMGLPTAGSETIWKDVRAVRAGACLIQRGTVRSAHRHWRAEEFAASPSMNDTTAIEQFRSLFAEAVRVRIDDPAHTWAQLSGGLDSSSVVAVANKEHAQVAGTVTLVDTMTGGDERVWSDAVVNRFHVRNEQITNYWAWQVDGDAPPRTDTPSPVYPFFARDRRMVETVRDSGGRVLLSGFGSDHYLFGNLHYITDLAARGKVNAAIRELLGWSVASRQSFWTMARDHFVAPFLPAARGSDPTDPESVPAWIDPVFARQHQVSTLMRSAHLAAARPGARFQAMTMAGIAAIPAWVHGWPFEGALDVRYPFLHRPLVEAVLAMPVAMRIRPGIHKWVLREAMHGILPEPVRNRSSKGSIDARILWSLQQERRTLDRMLRDPILAQLGCVDPVALRTSVDRARRGIPTNLVHLMSALSLETWLTVRAGRWTADARAAQSAA